MQFTVQGVATATGEMRQAIMAGIERGMEKIGLRGEYLVQQRTPVGYSGNLEHSIHSTVTVLPTETITQIASGPPADVYAAPVETGTRPHFPPMEALLPWVKAKFGATDDDARSIAFLIARAIARRGTRAQRMFENALPQLMEEAPGILEREIAESINAAGLGVAH